MKLYIFEPHEWSYCGGAIGIIAETFDEAVKIVITDDKIQAKQTAQKCKTSSLYTKNLSVDDHRTYRSKYFQRNSDGFKKDHSDQWLLTHKIQVTDDEQPRILFDNWNYA